MPPPSGVADGAAVATAAPSAARRARPRAGAPMMYSSTDSGSNPYSTKVMTAPSTVPWLDKASASAIISTT